MPKQRLVIYIEDDVNEKLKELSPQSKRNAAGDLVSKWIDRAWKEQNSKGIFVEFYDKEFEDQFSYVVDNNDMSPEDTVRKVMRREYFDLTDGINQRNLIRHIYVLLRISVFLLLGIAQKSGVEIQMSASEENAWRNSLNVKLDRREKKGGEGK